MKSVDKVDKINLGFPRQYLCILQRRDCHWRDLSYGVLSGFLESLTIAALLRDYRDKVVVLPCGWCNVAWLSLVACYRIKDGYHAVDAHSFKQSVCPHLYW